MCLMASEAEGGGSEPLTKQDFEALAQFRFGIRRYLRFSEEAVRRDGLTPQQHQLLLALKGFPGRNRARARRTAPAASSQRRRTGQPGPASGAHRAGSGPQRRPRRPATVLSGDRRCPGVPGDAATSNSAGLVDDAR